MHSKVCSVNKLISEQWPPGFRPARLDNGVHQDLTPVTGHRQSFLMVSVRKAYKSVWPMVSGGLATGHAFVGVVVGQRVLSWKLIQKLIADLQKGKYIIWRKYVCLQSISNIFSCTKSKHLCIKHKMYTLWTYTIHKPRKVKQMCIQNNKYKLLS